VAERKRALACAVSGPVPVLAHCGAQTTADTVALAVDAAEAGAEAVAVIAPPYFHLDGDALLAHFVAAARACAPLPFYAYELEKASGYAIPPAVVGRLRDAVDNLVGMKVSDAPFSKVRPYFLDGLDVFIGAESLIGEGLKAGAAGAVSGLAAAFPEVVVEAVRSGDSTRAGELRAVIERYPRHAASKAVVAARGVPIGEDVRAPLRGLTDAERNELLAAVAYAFDSPSSSIA
jgi:dihydrodipicolinate synthase/N-acetylneuraminate lyase